MSTKKVKKTTYIEISPELFDSLKDYCDLNGLNMCEYVESLIKKNFMVDKYGEAPSVFQKIKEEKPQTPNKEPEQVSSIPHSEEEAPKSKIRKKIKTY